MPGTYVPNYGVEPCDQNGVRTVTGENLIISLWDDTFTTVMRPAVQADFTPSIPGQQPGYKVAFNSRYAAQFRLKDLTGLVGAILNPPAEFKQQLAGAAYYDDTGVNPDPLQNVRFTKSVRVVDVWEPIAVGAATYAYPQYLAPLNVMFNVGLYLRTNVLGTPFRFARTNGADGNPPTFFGVATPNEVKAYIAAVNRGEFYVPVLFQPSASGARLGIVYPHSSARG